MKPSGAHTHPHSGSGLPAALAVTATTALAVSVAGPVLRAVAALLRAVLITGAVCAAVAIIALAALIACRLRRARDSTSGHPFGLAARATRPQASPAPPTAALRHPAAPAIHLHLYGMSAQDVAEALARQPITTDYLDGG